MTEQIGARRRDIYSSDTWIPADDQIVWPYAKRNMSNLNDSAKKESRKASNDCVELDAENPTKASSVGLHVPSFLQGARKMDVFAAVLDQCPEKSPREVYIKLLEDVRDEVSKQKGKKIDHGTFVDEFFCLFFWLEIMKSAPKLVTSLIGEFPRAQLLSIPEYVSAVSIPPRGELHALRESINSLDLSKLLPPQLREVVRMYIFLNHPLVTSFLTGYKPSSAVVSTKEVFPSKSIIKEIAQSVPRQYRGIVNEGFRSKSLNESLVYIFLLVKPHLSAGHPRRETVESMFKLVPPETLQEASFLESLNEKFRKAMFPPSKS